MQFLSSNAGYIYIPIGYKAHRRLICDDDDDEDADDDDDDDVPCNQ